MSSKTTPTPEPTLATNSAPPGFDPAKDLPKGFIEFLVPLHEQFTPRQRTLIEKRDAALQASLRGRLPDYLPPSAATQENWRIELPAWCQDQRNQMTGPADDGELVVKMLNSGAPGVMLDLEDSMANAWPNLLRGVENIRRALNGTLTYEDAKRGHTVGITLSPTVIWNRVRGLHLAQAGLFADGALTSA